MLYGLVPIENSSIGSVLETMDALRDTQLAVREMVALKIGHALLGRAGVVQERVKRVYSHEQVRLSRAGPRELMFVRTQGIGQCVEYLAERYPKAEVVPVNSTARAAQLASEDGEALAICSLKCAEVYGLEVVDTDIQDGGEGAFCLAGENEGRS